MGGICNFTNGYLFVELDNNNNNNNNNSNNNNILNKK